MRTALALTAVAGMLTSAGRVLAQLPHAPASLLVAQDSSDGRNDKASPTRPDTGASSKPKAPDTGSREGGASGPREHEGPPARADFGWFNFQPLSTWRTKAAPGGTQMRRAEYTIPAVPGDTEDGRLVVFYFGPGQGGSADANLARWSGQFRKPEGMSDEDHSVLSKQKVDGLEVTIAELRGTYDPGARFQEQPKPGYMMLSAVVETGGGNYFVHTIGPEKTLLECRSRWYAMMLDLKAGSAAKK